MVLGSLTSCNQQLLLSFYERVNHFVFVKYKNTRVNLYILRPYKIASTGMRPPVLRPKS